MVAENRNAAAPRANLKMSRAVLEDLKAIKHETSWFSADSNQHCSG